MFAGRGQRCVRCRRWTPHKYGGVLFDLRGFPERLNQLLPPVSRTAFAHAGVHEQSTDEEEDEPKDIQAGGIG